MTWVCDISMPCPKCTSLHEFGTLINVKVLITSQKHDPHQKYHLLFVIQEYTINDALALEDIFSPDSLGGSLQV